MTKTFELTRKQIAVAELQRAIGETKLPGVKWFQPSYACPLAACISDTLAPGFHVQVGGADDITIYRTTPNMRVARVRAPRCLDKVVNGFDSHKPIDPIRFEAIVEAAYTNPFRD
jgi:hypothetical protein